MTDMLPAIKGLRGGRMTWSPTPDRKKIQITGRCCATGNLHQVLVEPNEMKAFDPASKKTIQQQFPSIARDLDSMEFLISGIAPAGWDRIFGTED